MKSTLLKKLFLMSALAIGAVVAHAETLTFAVPFAFSAGGKTLPAGSYTVESSGRTLYVRGAPGSSVVMAIPSLSPVSKGTAYFDQSSEGAALASVTLPNGMMYTVTTVKRSSVAAVVRPGEVALGTRH